MEKSPTVFTICWDLQAPRPVFFRSLQLCGPTSVCIIIAKIGIFLWLVGVTQPWFCCIGVGCCFLKATSYVRPAVLLLLSCLPSAALPPLLPQPPHPEFWKAHLLYSCLLWDGAPPPPFHLMLYVMSFFRFVFVFFPFSPGESCGCVLILGLKTKKQKKQVV